MRTKNNSIGTKDFFFNLSKTKQHAFAMLVLFIIPFLLFTASTIGGKEFQRHDITQWRAGAESLFEYKETYGETPLWATNMFGGMPAYAIMNAIVTPHLDSFSKFFSKIYPAFPYWVMLSGMYFFLIIAGFESLSALFGSLLFGLTSYFAIIVGAGHTSKLAALSYIPWVIAGYWILFKSPKKILGLLVFSIAMSLELRAGHPQITYYFFYLIGFLWLSDSWAAFKEKQISSLGLATLFMVFGVALGVMSHAPHLFTLQEYSPFSIRGGSAIKATTGLNSGYAFAWSQGIKETLTLLVPDLFGGASPDYWGPKSVTSGPHYLGALSLPFIFLALLRKRNSVMYVFFGVGTLAILFAWGGHFLLFNQFAFDHIPFFNKFRAPETWLVLTIFCYSVVAVYGFEWLAKFLKEKPANGLKPLYLPLGLSFGIAAIILVQVNSMTFTKKSETAYIANQIAQQNNVNPNNPQVQQQANNYVKAQLVPGRQEKAKKDVLRLFIFLAVSTGLIFLAYSDKIPVSVACLGLVVLLMADLLSVDKRYIPKRIFVSGNVDSKAYLESQRRDIDTFIQEHISENSTYPYRVFPLLDDAFSNAIPAYFYPSIGGYSGAKLSIIQDAIDNDGPLFKGQYGLNMGLLRLLNIKYLTYQAGLRLPGLTPVFQGKNGASVYQVNDVLPKAFFVDSVLTVSSAKDAFSFLDPGKLDFSKTAVVESNDALISAPDSVSKVEVTKYTGQDIVMEISRSQPGFLVISEIYYPKGWVALLDGEEIPIYKTDYLLRGISVPSGNHTLALTFAPKSYALGTTLSWISLFAQILIAAFVGFTFYRDRSKGGS